MRLKYRLLYQNILVLLSTVIITGCAGFGYYYIAHLWNKTSPSESLSETAVVVLKNDQILYNSHHFSKVQIREMLMDIGVKNREGSYNNTKYKLNSDSFLSQDNTQFQIIKLTPIEAPENADLTFMIFLAVIFLAVFFIAGGIVRRQNLNNIVLPIMELKNETERLRTGELDAAITDEGYDEVGELGKEIEQLRLKLKDSIYYQKRIDDDRKFLISSISHDLKTPVTAIRGYIDGVLDGIADTEEKKQEYLKKAIAKTKLINMMIEDLLLYSKLDLNQISYKMEKVDITKYIQDCTEDSLEQFERENKSIQIINELKKPIFVNMDRDQFKRVVQNVLDNAKKNIAVGGGLLAILLRETTSSVILEFKDNGKGIGQKELPNIFERFYRADSARAVEGSSGLGLAIAKQIVEGIGGRIWAVSKEDVGTSIMISLKKSL